MILPEKFLERMKSQLGDDYDEFISSYQIPPYTAVRLNPLKENSAELFEKEFGRAEAVPWCKWGRYVDKATVSGNHPYHIAGAFYFQEPSAMIAAEMLPLSDGDLVLDLCAAPGGKSTQLAAHSNIHLVANEIVPKRSITLSENIERMGFSNVCVTNESPTVLENHFPEYFDKILVDAPCSGEGMFKKEPEAILSWSPEHVSSCAERQKKIIDSAVKMLAPGGSILYSTCTFSEQENEDIVSFVENKYPHLSVTSQKKLYPHKVKGEGHFAALFTDNRQKERISSKALSVSIDAEHAYRDFENTFLNCHLSGKFLLFGTNLYLMSRDIPMDKLKVVRPGLHLGELKKNRFEPAHALSKALKMSDFKNYINCNTNDVTIKKYIRGETFPGNFKGYGAVLCNGLPLGWVKGSDGTLKNKFPKRLRTVMQGGYLYNA